MRAPEIASYIESRGFASSSENLANSLFTALRRRPDLFEKIGRGQWALKVWNMRSGDSGEGDNDEP